MLAGGTGFIGSCLTKQFNRLGYQVVIVSRWPPFVQWKDEKALIHSLEGSGLVVNLAGKSVDCRYNQRNRDEIIQSRIETTSKLGEAISNCVNPPELWINLSTATIYRDALDREMTEAHGELGKGFSVEVATRWEETFFSFRLSKTRLVALRTAIVLGRNARLVKMNANLVKYGLGGMQGNGRQMFSWLHIDDLVRIIQFIWENPALSGIYNASSPNPVTNKQFMQTFRRIKGVRFGFPVPAWILGTGAFFLRTEPELVLKSRWVLPDRLIKHGFIFKYPDLEQALKSVT